MVALDPASLAGWPPAPGPRADRTRPLDRPDWRAIARRLATRAAATLARHAWRLRLVLALTAAWAAGVTVGRALLLHLTQMVMS
ncbi:hypothetical protein EDC65_2277 [Stella humosa]|uniref:Uncharacterized protein n=1 Tax=Stella humosa TaxID=94 RepID=A0A3N1MA14_9PROT|nr:hypothetical protein [Stella humosa]ROQ00478.1 hypothetical protein EDC65_2277 [Stella humosa]BBK30277.1 hypothetical protein STHU_09110 [Stella humosa]